MNDELDNLPDEKLSEAFAVEIAGYEPGWSVSGMARGPDGFRRKVGDAWEFVRDLPCYATDANAVLPWLEQAKVSGMDIRRFADGWGISLRMKADATAEWQAARAPTFARAACLALIRAAREKAKRS